MTKNATRAMNGPTPQQAREYLRERFRFFRVKDVAFYVDGKTVQLARISDKNAVKVAEYISKNKPTSYPTLGHRYPL